MKFKSDPVAATLLERPNRFLGVVDLEGARTQCHIPDPGRMRELLYPGAEVYLVESHGEGRKTAYDMVLADHGGTMVSVDSRLPNRLLAEAIEAGSLPEFTGYRVARTEPTFMDSRFDLLLARGRSELVLEAKSCTLVEGGVALFPDAPTLRGARHMRTLVHALRDSEAAAVFVVQRTDARVFRPHREMDPGFRDALVAAASAGVQVYAYRCDVSLEGVRIAGRIPVSLE
ncbi:MAG TPA: DNA/RNA nuclease SfsA [Candidatus Bathyarchaeia archaeon]